MHYYQASSTLLKPRSCIHFQRSNVHKTNQNKKAPTSRLCIAYKEKKEVKLSCSDVHTAVMHCSRSHNSRALFCRRLFNKHPCETAQQNAACSFRVFCTASFCTSMSQHQQQHACMPKHAALKALPLHAPHQSVDEVAAA
jgi:hypothetical protein